MVENAAEAFFGKDALLACFGLFQISSHHFEKITKPISDFSLNGKHAAVKIAFRQHAAYLAQVHFQPFTKIYSR